MRPSCPICATPMRPHGTQLVDDVSRDLWTCDGRNTHRSVKVVGDGACAALACVERDAGTEPPTLTVEL